MWAASSEGFRLYFVMVNEHSSHIVLCGNSFLEIFANTAVGA